MERFFGFDLGDAESAVARVNKDPSAVCEILDVAGVKSFISAYARLQNGELLIGESACYEENAVLRRLRFKSNFLKDEETDTYIFYNNMYGKDNKRGTGMV